MPLRRSQENIVFRPDVAFAPAAPDAHYGSSTTTTTTTTTVIIVKHTV